MSLSGVVLFSYPSDSDFLQDSIRTRIMKLTFWITGFTDAIWTLMLSSLGFFLHSQVASINVLKEKGRKNEI